MNIRQKALIASGEQLCIDRIADILSSDLDVMSAMRGAQAFEIALSSKPDLILLDMDVLDMDQMELLANLNQAVASLGVPVFAIASSVSPEDESKWFDEGIADYFLKPFQPSVVKSRIRTHLALKVKGDMLETLAKRDALTLAPNRTAFEQLFDREWSRGLRGESSLSLLFADIDKLQDFNDGYGFGEGDVCLQRVAHALLEAVRRPGDFIARFGGGKFVGLLADTPEEGGVHVAEGFRSAITALNIPHAASDFGSRLTISVGVASAKISSDASVSQASLIELAERSLSQAKERGGNSVVGSTL